MTIALPYANGEIHLGHLVEAVQGDIWARFQRSRGHDCLFICGNDAHGTAVMLAAEKAGISPEAFVDQVNADHLNDFKQFLISFDNFYSSHSPENEKLSQDVYKKLQARGDIKTREISQLYDPEKNIFLADRFIRGECPKCHEPDQYGDNCEKCGATYSPTDLINPKSAISGATPVMKQSEHYFFCLEHHTDLLKEWIDSGHLQKPVANKLKEWFEEGLQPWDISRDAPYFGFEIPDAPGKYFYVWLDAPIGYMASLQNYCTTHGCDFMQYWQKDSTTELYHFVGKDIVYFHALFWPAMLYAADYRMPTAVFAHGFLTVNGQKMSKSRNTFITAKEYLSHLNPEYIRYYFAAKLNADVEDIDLNFEDFMQRVNSDLVGKYVNLASRCAGFITKKFDGVLAKALPEPALFDECVAAGETIAESFESLNYNKAVRDIMSLADRANQYIDQHKPWVLAKDENTLADVQPICTQGLNLFKLLSTYLKPILPETAEKVEAFLNCEPMTWGNRAEPLVSHKINKFKPLMVRVTPEDIEPLS